MTLKPVPMPTPEEMAEMAMKLVQADRYRRMAAKYDGEFGVFRHCSRCIAIMEALYAAGAESVDIGLNCGESWEENFGEIPADVAALAFMTPDEAQAMVRRAAPQEEAKG